MKEDARAELETVLALIDATLAREQRFESAYELASSIVEPKGAQHPHLRDLFPSSDEAIARLTLLRARVSRALAMLTPTLSPPPSPYRPWVVNLNPDGQRYGRIGCVTAAANGKADVAYDDGVGMHVDIKKHLVLVADLGFTDKERLRCGCGSGFPSLWCCWNKEPTKRETGYVPRVCGVRSGEEVIVSVDASSFDAASSSFRSLILQRADGSTYSARAEGLSLAPRNLLREPSCGCGSEKDAIRCHPMSPPAKERDEES